MSLSPLKIAASAYAILLLCILADGTCCAQDYSPLESHTDSDVQQLYRKNRSIFGRRIWKSANGNFSTIAEFVYFDRAKQSVRLDDKGSLIDVPIEMLDEKSIALVDLYLSSHRSLSRALLEMRESNFTKMEQELEELRSEIKKANAQRDQLAAENKKLRMHVPSNALAADNGVPLITQNQLEAIGEQFRNKKVRVINSEFGDVSQLYAKEFGDGYVGFYADDSKGDSINFFADKATYANFVVSLNRGDRLNITGTVTYLDFAGDEWLIKVEQMEKAEPSR